MEKDTKLLLSCSFSTTSARARMAVSRAQARAMQGQAEVAYEESQNRPQLVEKGEKLGQIASVCKNLSVHDGFIVS